MKLLLLCLVAVFANEIEDDVGAWHEGLEEMLLSAEDVTTVDPEAKAFIEESLSNLGDITIDNFEEKLGLFDEEDEEEEESISHKKKNGDPRRVHITHKSIKNKGMRHHMRIMLANFKKGKNALGQYATKVVNRDGTFVWSKKDNRLESATYIKCFRNCKKNGKKSKKNCRKHCHRIGVVRNFPKKGRWKKKHGFKVTIGPLVNKDDKPDNDNRAKFTEELQDGEETAIGKIMRRHREQHGEDAVGEAVIYYTVMVYYTNRALARSGNVAAMDQRIVQAVAETNVGYANSAMNIRAQLGGIAAYGSKSPGSKVGAGTLLNGFKGTSKNNHDLAVLIYDKDDADYCGMAWVKASTSSAYGVVQHGCMVGYYSFGHEIGHNLGLHHNAYWNGCIKNCGAIIKCGNGGQRTVMSYTSSGKPYTSFPGRRRASNWQPHITCMGAHQGSETRINFYSNPAKATGLANVADNAHRYRDWAPTIAGYGSGGDQRRRYVDDRRRRRRRWWDFRRRARRRRRWAAENEETEVMDETQDEFEESEE